MDNFDHSFDHQLVLSDDRIWAVSSELAEKTYYVSDNHASDLAYVAEKLAEEQEIRIRDVDIEAVSLEGLDKKTGDSNE